MIYRQHNFIKYLLSIVFGIFALSGIATMMADQNLVLMGMIECLPLALYVLYYHRSYVELTDDGVIINKGAIFHDEQFIKYSKINNVELNRGLLTLPCIRIYVGNDKPLFFNNIEKGQELRNKIVNKIS